MKRTNEIEITRNNIKLAQFIGYIKRRGGQPWETADCKAEMQRQRIIKQI